MTVRRAHKLSSVHVMSRLEALDVEKAVGARLRRELSRTAEQGNRTGAYLAVREDAGPKRQRSKRRLSTDQGGNLNSSIVAFSTPS